MFGMKRRKFVRGIQDRRASCVAAIESAGVLGMSVAFARFSGGWRCRVTLPNGAVAQAISMNVPDALFRALDKAGDAKAPKGEETQA